MKLPYLIYQVLSLGKTQITRTLPRRFWDRIEIIENNESLIELQTTEKLILQPSDISTSFLVRKTVAEKLYKMSESLPDRIKLCVIEGYRSLEKQQRAWDRKYNVVKSENPDWSDEEINHEVGLVVARPIGITNHVCGGAVDVMLVNQNNEPLDFGTKYAPVDESGRKKCPMFADDLTDEQKQNRKLLRNRMESVGFVWYPGEWWHYCYGDRMWALYTGQKKCFYGPINN
jgi:D-alanyl-D-alanine dipeptidase